MRINRKFGIGMIAMLLMFSGCAQAKLPEVIETSTVAINKDGAVSQYVVETFDKDYYSVSELNQMAVKEAAAYNEKYQLGETVPVTVNKVEGLVAADGSDKAIVEYMLDSTDTYTDFNETALFYGTVAQAKAKNLNLDVTLSQVKDNAQVSGQELFAGEEKKIIVTDAKAVIYCPGRVSHLSEGAVYNTDGSVDTSNAEGTVYIVLK